MDFLLYKILKETAEFNLNKEYVFHIKQMTVVYINIIEHLDNGKQKNNEFTKKKEKGKTLFYLDFVLKDLQIAPQTLNIIHSDSPVEFPLIAQISPKPLYPHLKFNQIAIFGGIFT